MMMTTDDDDCKRSLFYFLLANFFMSFFQGFLRFFTKGPLQAPFSYCFTQGPVKSKVLEAARLPRGEFLGALFLLVFKFGIFLKVSLVCSLDCLCRLHFLIVLHKGP